jgi:NAD(P)-dependent dehydrogenase (short-subunit alcohol dehydrogenase family)
VVVTARNAQALDNCVAEIERVGSEGLAVPGDVSGRAQVQRVVDAAVERFGRIDTYVANAIVTVYAEAERLQPDELRRVWDVNFFGVVYGYWAALPHLRSSRRTFLTSTLRCAEHPLRELPVSWGAQKLLWGQKLSPRAGDWILRPTGWKSQHTARRKPVDAPDNLFDTLPGDPGARGRFDDQARGSTLWTRLRLLSPKGRGGSLA